MGFLPPFWFVKVESYCEDLTPVKTCFDREFALNCSRTLWYPSGVEKIGYFNWDE
jgi:hypothetical protein